MTSAPARPHLERPLTTRAAVAVVAPAAAAGDGAVPACLPPAPGQLQQTLASMPLKIWRTNQVTPLTPHPSDPVTMST